jgi:hypothetical protein
MLIVVLQLIFSGVKSADTGRLGMGKGLAGRRPPWDAV